MSNNKKILDDINKKSSMPEAIYAAVLLTMIFIMGIVFGSMTHDFMFH